MLSRMLIQEVIVQECNQSLCNVSIMSSYLYLGPSIVAADEICTLYSADKKYPTLYTEISYSTII